ncbi:MAG: CpsD/CapB family tyrosine-protein kinase, partial [Clostridia bacterium]|nr:CpsD/CapB family tyrosine-protein kinase [Clostridia bacterium]
MLNMSIGNLQKLPYDAEEAVNTLCTNLSFVGSGTKKIMFTSCIAHEGKTFTAMNVMRTMTKLGYKTVMVDADLRKSILAAKFDFHGVENGLSHYLAGRADIEDIIYQTNVPNGFIVPVGVCVGNPLPLLNSRRFTKLLDYLAEQADYVIVDA